MWFKQKLKNNNNRLNRAVARAGDNTPSPPCPNLRRTTAQISGGVFLFILFAGTKTETTAPRTLL